MVGDASASRADRSLQRVLLRQERNGLPGAPAGSARVPSDHFARGVIGRSRRKRHGRASGAGRESSDGRGGGRERRQRRLRGASRLEPAARPVRDVRRGRPRRDRNRPRGRRQAARGLQHEHAVPRDRPHAGKDGAFRVLGGGRGDHDRHRGHRRGPPEIPASHDPRLDRSEHPQRRGREVLPVDRRLAGGGRHEADPQGAGLPERADRRRDRNPDPREQVLYLPREMLDVSLSPSRAHHGFLREGPVQGKPEPRRPRLPRLHGVVGALLRRGEVGEQRVPEERCVLPSGRHPAPDRPGGPVPEGAGARVSRASRGERGQVLPGSDRRLYRLPERRSLRPFAVAVPPRRNPDGAGHGPLRRDPATADGSAAASACDLSLLRKPVLPRQIQESLGHLPVAVRDLVAVWNVGVRRIRIVESVRELVFRSAAPFAPPGLRKIPRHVEVVHHEIEDRPHARRCAERVAASQREQHPARGELIRPRQNSPEKGLVIARRQHEIGERIVEMRICPGLDHEDIGAKVPQSGRKHLLEHLEVAPALGERLQRQIELQAATDSGAELADLTGPGEEVLARLVQAHGQNALVFVQNLLDEDERVMTVSLHESGKYLFPGTGEIRELGSGVGRGLKLNLPLEPFTEGGSYLEVFEQVLPAALRHFCPDVLVVQAGTDAHFDDPLSDLMLTTHDYEALFRRILAWADEFTAGRVLFTLGGGYSFRAAPRVWAILYLVMHDLHVARDLPESWRSKWSRTSENELPHTLHDPNPSHADIPNRYEIAHRNRHVAERLLDLARQYWFPQ